MGCQIRIAASRSLDHASCTASARPNILSAAAWAWPTLPKPHLLDQEGLRSHLAPGLIKIKRNISSLITVPSTDGVDNTAALHAVHGPMVMGSSGFVSAGVQLFGHQPPPEEPEFTDLLDENADPIVIPRRGKRPPTATGGPGRWLPAVNLPPIMPRPPTSTFGPPNLEDRLTRMAQE